MGALDQAVRSGKALYAGISNYNASQAAAAIKILRELGTPCLIHQPKYSMFMRTPEQVCWMCWARRAWGRLPLLRWRRPLDEPLSTRAFQTGSRATTKKNSSRRATLTSIGSRRFTR